MKKLKAFLTEVCLLSTMCVLTSCGGNKWEIYTEDNENGELISVSHSHCRTILSTPEKDEICKKLEDKYSNVKVKVTEDSVKGLLKDAIPIKEDDGEYFSEDEVRAEELDSIFAVDGHSVETVVSVGIYKEDDMDFMEYEIYAYYDDNENKYFFAEIDYFKESKTDEKSGKKSESEKEEDKGNVLEQAEKKFRENFDSVDPDCVSIGSDGSYLKVDTNPNDIDGGSSNFSEILSYKTINQYLDLPEALNELMGETSASDGRVTRTYGNITVSWKYHPDTGLEVMYELTE